jgi:hypothetical protein
MPLTFAQRFYLLRMVKVGGTIPRNRDERTEKVYERLRDKGYIFRDRENDRIVWRVRPQFMELEHDPRGQSQKESHNNP